MFALHLWPITKELNIGTYICVAGFLHVLYNAKIYTSNEIPSRQLLQVVECNESRSSFKNN